MFMPSAVVLAVAVPILCDTEHGEKTTADCSRLCM